MILPRQWRLPYGGYLFIPNLTANHGTRIQVASSTSCDRAFQRSTGVHGLLQFLRPMWCPVSPLVCISPSDRAVVHPVSVPDSLRDDSVLASRRGPAASFFGSCPRLSLADNSTPPRFLGIQSRLLDVRKPEDIGPLHSFRATARPRDSPAGGAMWDTGFVYTDGVSLPATICPLLAKLGRHLFSSGPLCLRLPSTGVRVSMSA